MLSNKMSKKNSRVVKRVNRKIQSLVVPFKKNLVRVYWFNDIPNFGDLLTPKILKFYGLQPMLSGKSSSDLLFIGSILDSLREDYSGHIIGSGLIRDSFRRFPMAKILAVRGEFTRERIGAPKSTVLGDPGLLASKLLKKRSKKKYVLGIVPHYVDKSDWRIENLYNKNNKDVLIIDPQLAPIKVIENIDQCEFILSSSLHGLVVADSLGIHNAWIKLSNEVVGNGFKFIDYSSAYKAKLTPINVTGFEKLSDLIKMTHFDKHGVTETKEQLGDLVMKYSEKIINN